MTGAYYLPMHDNPKLGAHEYTVTCITEHPGNKSKFPYFKKLKYVIYRWIILKIMLPLCAN